MLTVKQAAVWGMSERTAKMVRAVAQLRPSLVPEILSGRLTVRALRHPDGRPRYNSQGQLYRTKGAVRCTGGNACLMSGDLNAWRPASGLNLPPSSAEPSPDAEEQRTPQPVRTADRQTA